MCKTCEQAESAKDGLADLLHILLGIAVSCDSAAVSSLCWVIVLYRCLMKASSLPITGEILE